MTVLQEHFLLSNGMPMPKLGFGTWQITDAQQAYDATASALASGYRHIDTSTLRAFTTMRKASAALSATVELRAQSCLSQPSSR